MKIIDKQIIGKDKNARIVQIKVYSPLIAGQFRAGQFVIIMVSRESERIPLTIADSDIKTGAVTIIFQELGYSTKLLGSLRKGRSLYALSGPLGNPADISNYGKVLVVGGGVGIAEVYPVVKALAENGCRITAVLGARTKSLLILKDQIRGYCEKTFITTDDGTIGKRGFITDVLKETLKKNSDFNLVYCVGPVVMMRKVAEMTKVYSIKTKVSLNAIMLDGTGMCGSCRVKLGNKTKLCCVDGPDFNAHCVDFDQLLLRQDRFLEKEKLIKKIFKQ
ncbi:MAG: sulfide/dihydroorotate dehydrogenase-like FAD/NAD-binding protein [Candidatus Omnitrophica bacterium]|nr:sulfide/dihydroorotate dehydrogenase-like FAD/NAD-binding protein [Candidatus Omnitrophota bacterium]